MTPMMKQYLEVKEQYKDCILFFRLGDFYEMFLDDALLVSKELEITLTGRSAGEKEKIPMCGVPYHSADGYIARLIDKGYKIAICEQVEDPKTAKGIVKRDVIRIITPGTVLNEQVLEEKANNFLVSIIKCGHSYGLATADVSTGEFLTTEIAGENALLKLREEMLRLSPAEIVLPEDVAEELRSLGQNIALLSYESSRNFALDNAKRNLLNHFNVNSLASFGCDDKESAVMAAGGLLSYLKNTQKCALNHITSLTAYSIGSYMVLDPVTRKNLELSKTMHNRKKRGTVFWALDKTQTSMGGRLLQQWIEQPLLEAQKINLRLNAVEELTGDMLLRSNLADLLQKIYDMERLMTRIAYGTANARDLLMLLDSLIVLPEIKALTQKLHSAKLHDLAEDMDCLTDLAELIGKSIHEEPPVSVREGGLIKEGYNEEADKLREARTNGKSWLKDLEQEEREKTGIKNIKIGYNRVFGYYLEVTKSNISLVPDYYIRKQTLTNGERYITEKLKEYEDMILGAETKLVELEYRLFTEIREKTALEMTRVQKTAHIIAELDVLLSLAETALAYNYCKPLVDDSNRIEIEAGRHLVIERLQDNQYFIPNDTNLNHEENELLLITGPNMAGKSTYMRQVALIVLLAQIGSYVPATKAHIGTVDRIFTRIGAADDIITGQSTFMVEMQELANILHNATEKSFIILDEIGRGTSTYDGLSIAWAAVEYLHEKLKAKTLFATHYHELTELADKLPRVQNFSVAVKEEKGDIVFLRKIVEGKVDRSYGVHVAKLAGLPQELLERASKILVGLEKKDDIELKIKSDVNVAAEIKADGYLAIKSDSVLKSDTELEEKDDISSKAIMNPGVNTKEDIPKDLDQNIEFVQKEAIRSEETELKIEEDKTLTDEIEKEQLALGDEFVSEKKSKRKKKKNTGQMSLFGEISPIVEELKGLRIMEMNPLEAMNKLYELQKKALEEN